MVFLPRDQVSIPVVSIHAACMSHFLSPCTHLGGKRQVFFGGGQGLSPLHTRADQVAWDYLGGEEKVEGGREGEGRERARPFECDTDTAPACVSIHPYNIVDNAHTLSLARRLLPWTQVCLFARNCSRLRSLLNIRAVYRKSEQSAAQKNDSHGKS